MSQPTGILTLARHENLFDELEDYAKRHNLGGAWLSGLGGAEVVELGFYDLASKQYLWQRYEKALEIVSLTGNLAWVDQKPFWHIHGVFSDKDMSTVAGHVKFLQVGLTCEILLTPLEQSYGRKHDDETGLKLLYCQQG